MSIVCLHLTEIDISSTFYSKHKKETPVKSCEAYKQSTKYKWLIFKFLNVLNSNLLRLIK